MKLEITKVALLSAFALTNPLLILAAGQYDKLQASVVQTQNPPIEAQYAGGTPQAVQPGKDTGTVRSDVFLQAETPPIETPAEPPCVQYGKHTCPNWNDQAFHK
jgi:hypothetical protein